MQNNLNKYFGLMALLFGGLLGSIAIIVILFYLLKLFSIAMFNIPGADNVFHVFIIMVPYLILRRMRGLLGSSRISSIETRS